MPDQAAMLAAPPGHPLAVALALLRADAPGQIMSAPQDWPRWAALLPHVLAATDHADPAAYQLNSEAMPDASWLLDRAGTYLQVNARLIDAKTLLERALAIAEAAYGDDHPQVGIALNNLASVLQALGQPQTARPLQERALAIAEAAYGPGHPTVGAALSNLARILRALGQLAAARQLQERALAINEAVQSARSRLAGEEVSSDA
jgi:tetratricopeptide (TPR) repeat protein